MFIFFQFFEVEIMTFKALETRWNKYKTKIVFQTDLKVLKFFFFSSKGQSVSWCVLVH